MSSIQLRLAKATALRRAALQETYFRVSMSALAASSNTRDYGAPDDERVVVAELLERPTWSVVSLLSKNKNKNVVGDDSKITLTLLRHVLRLSALPFPPSPEEQTSKLEALRTQLLFVRDIQSFDTTRVMPLQAIRDETHEGLKGQTIGVKQVQQTLLQEVSFGHNRRPRRTKVKLDESGIEDWDVLATASQRAGRHIVVDGSRQ